MVWSFWRDSECVIGKESERKIGRDRTITEACHGSVSTPLEETDRWIERERERERERENPENHSPESPFFLLITVIEFKQVLEEADSKVKLLPATAQCANQQGKYLALCLNAVANGKKMVRSQPSIPSRLCHSLSCTCSCSCSCSTPAILSLPWF